MNCSVSVVPGPSQEWEDFVAGHPFATNYHQIDWRTVIERSFGHQGVYLLGRDTAGAVRGVLPLIYVKGPVFGRFLVSMPFFNYGGILADDAAVARALLDEADRLRQSWHAEYVELRHYGQACDPDLATRRHKVTMILALPDREEELWQSIGAKVRNQIRKAQKTLTATFGHLDLLDEFYEVFCRNMRDLGTPVYGKIFFQNILATFPATTKIVMIRLGGRPAAAGLMTWYRDTLEIPWAASNRDFRNLCPNNLLYWEALRFSLGLGMKRFDFGRSTPGEGTYNFKKQWGALPVPLFWQYLMEAGAAIPELNPKNPKFSMAIKVWQMLPVTMTKVIGPPIVRGIP